MNESPENLTGVIDGRGRFREIYQTVRADHGHELPDDRPCEEALLKLPGETPASGQAVHLGSSRLPLRIVIVPGLVADCFKNLFSPFAFARDHLEQHGFKSSVIWVSGRSSSAHNAAQINTAISNGDYPLHDRAVSRVLRLSYRMLAKQDARNDSQVIFSDSLIPGSVLLGYVNADHWAITLPIARVCPWLGATLVNRNAFPREVLLEAIVRYVEETLYSKSRFSQEQAFSDSTKSVT